MNVLFGQAMIRGALWEFVFYLRLKIIKVHQRQHDCCWYGGGLKSGGQKKQQNRKKGENENENVSAAWFVIGEQQAIKESLSELRENPTGMHHGSSWQSYVAVSLG